MQFLHIGFYKTGSTYLQEHFYPRLHTEVISDEGMIGHPSTNFIDWRERLDGIATDYQNYKILIIFRHQPSIIESLYKHGVGKGYPGDLESYIGIKPARPGIHQMAKGVDWKAFKFDEMIEGYQTRFGKDNILALPYEIMCSDIEDFCNRIADFIGCNRVPVIRKSSNVGANSALYRFHLFKNRIYARPARSRAIRFATVKLAHVLAICAGVFCPAARPMSKSVRDMIASHYAGDNHRLSDLVGVDLGQYGYFDS